MDWTRVDRILESLPNALRPGARAIILEASRTGKVPSLTEMERFSGLSRGRCRTIYQRFKATHLNPSEAKALEKRRHKVNWKDQPHAIPVAEMVSWFYGLPHTPTPSALTREQSAETLDKIIRLDYGNRDGSVDRLRKLLEFIVEDDRPGFCWKRVTRSLVGLRVRSRNGMYKHENAEAGMQQQRHEPMNVPVFDPALQRHLNERNTDTAP